MTKGNILIKGGSNQQSLLRVSMKSTDAGRITCLMHLPVIFNLRLLAGLTLRDKIFCNFPLCPE